MDNFTAETLKQAIDQSMKRFRLTIGGETHLIEAHQHASYGDSGIAFMVIERETQVVTMSRVFMAPSWELEEVTEQASDRMANARALNLVGNFRGTKKAKVN